MSRATFTVDEVAEDLASPFLPGLIAGDDIVREIARCAEVAERPRVKEALAALAQAQNAVGIAAAVELRDHVAAWLAYSMAWHVLHAIERVLVLADVVPDERAWPTRSHDEWREQWRAFVASGRAWEHRIV